MIVQGNERYADLLGACAAAKMAEEKTNKAFEEVRNQLRRIESKRTLGIKLTREERAFLILYGEDQKNSMRRQK